MHLHAQTRTCIFRHAHTCIHTHKHKHEHTRTSTHTTTTTNTNTTVGSVNRPHITSLIFSTLDGGAWLYVGSAAGDVLTVNVMRTSVQLVHPATRHGVGAMVRSSSLQAVLLGMFRP
jgi:hypothetical protein